MSGGSNLIGKYCLYMKIPLRTEFHDEVYTITGLHNVYDNYVFLNGDFESLYHVHGLLISGDIDYLNEILRVQKTYINHLGLLEDKVSRLKDGYNKKILEMLND